MAKQPKYPPLAHVKYVRSKGKVYAYFNTGVTSPSGKTIYFRMPDPSEPGFYGSYASLKGARTKRAAVEYMIPDLVRDFEAATERRTDLKQNTKDLYRHSNKHVIRLLSKYPVEKVTGADIRTLVENALDGAGSKNMFVTMLRNMYRWARIHGKTELDPTKDIKPVKTGEHAPWPEAIVAAGLAAEDARTRLAINLLYYTGQRISDVAKMRWDDIKDGEIHVMQEKTGKEVWPPIHSDLAEVLAVTPKIGATILASPTGEQWANSTIRNDITAFTLAAGKRCIPHGLRKNAVNALLEAGCTIAETASITGQSFGVVEKYARKVNQRKLGRKAMAKLENKDGTCKPYGKPEMEP